MAHGFKNPPLVFRFIINKKASFMEAQIETSATIPMSLKGIKDKLFGVVMPNMNVHVETVPQSDIVAAVPENVVTAPNQLTRIVTLKYQSCCGCGCRDVDVRRNVEWDSKLKDGDYITELLDTDEY